LCEGGPREGESQSHGLKHCDRGKTAQQSKKPCRYRTCMLTFVVISEGHDRIRKIMCMMLTMIDFIECKTHMHVTTSKIELDLMSYPTATPTQPPPQASIKNLHASTEAKHLL